MKTSPFFLYEQHLLLWKYKETKINLKRLHRCKLGRLWKSQKMKAPPNKLAYREDGNNVCLTGKCGIAFGQQQLNEETSNDKERNGKTFRQNLYVLPAGFGSFLTSSVLFFEQNTLDAEQEIDNNKSVGPYKQR